MAQLVELFEYHEPGRGAVEAMLDSRPKRSFNLSDLPWRDGMCAWCCTTPVKTERHKYCSKHCGDSAHYYCNPQAPASKAWRLLMLQGGACKGCGEYFEDEIVRLIHRRLEASNAWAKSWGGTPSDRITLYQIGHNTGDRWHVDHITPIFKGGRSIGIFNIQVLCVPCHKAKTAQERR